MFAWCSQKIGSPAAVAGDCISPPMSTCTKLCGWFSTSPKNPSRSAPPKPTSGTRRTNRVSDIDRTRSTSRSGSGSLERSGTNSGFGTTSPSTVRVSTANSAGRNRVSSRAGSE